MLIVDLFSVPKFSRLLAMHTKSVYPLVCGKTKMFTTFGAT